MRISVLAALTAALLLATGCPEEEGDRPDGAFRLLSDGGSLQDPCVAPDGERAVLTRFDGGYDTGAGELWQIDLGSGEAEVLLADGASDVVHAGSCWSELTGDVVFASDREDDRWELYRLDSDTGDVTRITNRPGLAATEASWSASADWVVFTSRPADDPDAPGTLTRVRPDGSEEQALSPAGADDRHPVASPAANLVVFETWDGESWTLAMSLLDGSGREALTDAAGDDRQPSWRWDSAAVVFSSDREGQGEPDLYTVQIDGCEIARLTEDEAFDGTPAYTPSNGHVLFESVPEGASRGDGTELWFLPAPSS